MTTLRRQVKNMVKNYSEAEVKVREATSNDPWGPSSTLMSEISDLTYNIVALGEVMRMIWKRLNDHGKNWRHVYKSLVLLDYLIKNGNEKVAQQCKEHIVAIQTLKDFQYMEEQKDQGQSVREKAKQLVNLLRDDERLKQERTKAFKARERFAQNAMGISSDNKMTYATSISSTHAAQIRTGSQANYSDPYGGAGASAAPDHLAADLEAVRPSDTNEEDLQIKLAIMLSQQEHEEEAQRKRTDEAKLHLALEQSKTEGQPNGLVDLADTGFGNAASSSDPWASLGVSASSNGNKNLQLRDQELDSASDEFFPPLHNNTSFNTKQQLNDPWSSSAGTQNGLSDLSQLTTNPWQSTNSGNSNTIPPQTLTDPWAVPTMPTQQALKNDDFDLFTSDRVVNQSPLTANTQNTTSNANINADPFGDFFGTTSNDQNSSNASTNPWNSMDDNKQNLTDLKMEQTKKQPDSFTQAAAQRKTPESFLGENSSLVNLENLIPTRPKSTNPFGANQAILSTQPSMSSSNSSGQLNNPFLAQQALQNQNQPTISQLQNQQKMQQQSAFPSFGNQSTFGQLPQPLIPPSTSIPNMAPLSFNPQTSMLTPTPPPQAQAPIQSNFNAFGATSANPQGSNQTTNPFLMM